MENKRFRLVARVSSSNPPAVGSVLEKFIAKGTVKEREDEFMIEAEMEGDSATELNRSLLSALRKGYELNGQPRTELPKGSLTTF